MGLSQGVIDRVLKPGQVIGLWFREKNQTVRKNLLILDVETSSLIDFSVGSATALSANGTSWNQVQDSSNRYLLQPQYEGILHQYFWGSYPGYAWMYTAYPANTVRGGLLNAPVIGGNPNIGFRRGWGSPYLAPSPLSESFITYGINPAYLGYHPYPLPASIAVYMNFYIFKYMVARTDAQPFREYTVGGSPPAEAPKWLQGSVAQAAAAAAT